MPQSYKKNVQGDDVEDDVVDEVAKETSANKAQIIYIIKKYMSTDLLELCRLAKKHNDWCVD